MTKLKLFAISLMSTLGITQALAAGPVATTAAAQPHGGSAWQMLLLPILLILVFYFLLIRPQSKRAKDQRMMLEKVNVGDEVMTAGGIFGRVVRLKDTYVVIKVCKDVDLTLQKSSIVNVLPRGTVDTLD